MAHERYRQTTDDRQTDGRRHIGLCERESRSLNKLAESLDVYFRIFGGGAKGVIVMKFCIGVITHANEGDLFRGFRRERGSNFPLFH